MPKTRTNDKLKVFELFKKGMMVKDIAPTSNVSEKSLYRWYKEYVENRNHTQQDSPSIETKIEAIKKEASADNGVIDWCAYVNEQSFNGCVTNGIIRKKLSEMMLEELNKSEINHRVLGVLSATIKIHSQLEREYGMYDLLISADMAYKKLESLGYVIVDPSIKN